MTWGETNHRTCTDHRAYEGWRRAEKAAHHHNQLFRSSASDFHFQPYRCRRCGLVHVGATRNDLRFKPRLREEGMSRLELRRVRCLADVLE